MKGIGRRSSKTTGAKISIATTLSVAENARNNSSVGDNRACADRMRGENEYGSG